MRHLTQLIFVSLVLAFAGLPAMAQPRDTIRILAIGNEWGADVCTHDTQAYFEAGGQPVLIGYVSKTDCDYAELAALADGKN